MKKATKKVVALGDHYNERCSGPIASQKVITKKCYINSERINCGLGSLPQEVLRGDYNKNENVVPRAESIKQVTKKKSWPRGHYRTKCSKRKWSPKGFNTFFVV